MYFNSYAEYCIPKKDNLGNLFMHLTNYAINKANSKFEYNQSCDRMDIGHKRSLTAVFAKLKESGKDTELIWRSICDIIVKTVVSVQPVLAHTYRSCQPDNLANNMCF
jgi:tubulin polyglutamylase TTLL6/13